MSARFDPLGGVFTSTFDPVSLARSAGATADAGGAVLVTAVVEAREGRRTTLADAGASGANRALATSAGVPESEADGELAGAALGAAAFVAADAAGATTAGAMAGPIAGPSSEPRSDATGGTR